MEGLGRGKEQGGRKEGSEEGLGRGKEQGRKEGRLGERKQGG